MAKQIKLAKGKEFEFRTPVKGGGGVSKYPWSTWLNGDIWLLEQSLGNKDDKGTIVDVEEQRDYEADTNIMPAKCKFAGRRAYKVVQISRLDADGHRLKDSIIIRARPMTTEEREFEDELRAREKAKFATRRKTKKEETTSQSTAGHVGEEAA